MIELTHAEWRAAAEALFGEDPKLWRFVCPSCGHEASVANFNAIKAGTGHRAATDCIGRLLREVGRADETYVGADRASSGKPCDWAAWGLLGTLNGGMAVRGDSGKIIHSFDFAGVKS